MAQLNNRMFDRLSGEYIDVSTTEGRVESVVDVIEFWQGRMDFIAEACGVSTALVCVIEGEFLKIRAVNQGLENTYRNGSACLIGLGCVAESVVARGETVFVADTRKEPWLDAPEYKRNVATAVGFPIRWPDNEVFGAIMLLSENTIEDLEYCKHLCQDVVSFLESNVLGKNGFLEPRLMESKKNTQSFEKIYGDICLDDARKQARQIFGFTIDMETHVIIKQFESIDGRSTLGMTYEHIIDTYRKTVPAGNLRDRFDEFYAFGHIKKVVDSGKKESMKYISGNLGVVYYTTGTFQGIKDSETGKSYAVFGFYDEDKVHAEVDFLASIARKDVILASLIDTDLGLVRVFYNGTNGGGYPQGLSSWTIDEFDALNRKYFGVASMKNRFGISSSGEFPSLVARSGNISVNLDNNEGGGLEGILRMRVMADEKNPNIIYLITDEIGDAVKAELDAKIQVKEALDVAKMASRAKTEFMGRMSHDLRTPMNAILNMANFGSEEAQRGKLKNYFDVIGYSSKHMLSLLDDVLNIQNIELGQGKSDISVMDVFQEADTLAAIIKSRADHKGVRFTHNFSCFKASPYRKCNKDVFEKICLNVLGNSVKYTPIGGIIDWSGRLDEDGRVVLLFEDNGIGMSPEFTSQMFEPFAREKNGLSDTVEGSGLGLTIVKDLVEFSKGAIDVESFVGIGTKISIYLPVENVTEEEIKEYESNLRLGIDTNELKGLKALVCEDNLINVKVIEHILDSFGVKMELAENGFQGVGMARENSYDFILMDIRMPIMDGLQAAVEIRKFDTLIPIIALSANAYRADIKASLNAGMNAHIPKPIKRNQLFMTVARFVKNSG